MSASDCCGKPLMMWMDDGGVFLLFCKSCSEEICSGCAGYWESDAGEEPGSVQTYGWCKKCWAEKQQKRAQARLSA